MHDPNRKVSNIERTLNAWDFSIGNPESGTYGKKVIWTNEGGE